MHGQALMTVGSMSRMHLVAWEKMGVCYKLKLGGQVADLV